MIEDEDKFKGLLYSPEVLGGIGLLTQGLSGAAPSAALPSLLQGMQTASLFKKQKLADEKQKLIDQYSDQVPESDKALFKIAPEKYIAAKFKTSKANFENFINKAGNEITVNTASSSGLAKATDLVDNQGYTRMSKSVQAGNKSDLMAKKSQGVLEGDLLNAYEARDLLENIDVMFKPEYVTYAGKGKAFIAAEAQKFGIDTPEKLDIFLGNQSAWKADVLKYTNKYRKHITGVAAGGKEITLLANSIANPNDAPTVFKAKIKTQRIQNDMLIRRNELFLSEGIGGITRDKEGKPNGKYKEYLEKNPIKINKQMAVEFVQTLANDNMSNEQIELRIKQVFGRENLDKVIEFLK